MTDISSFMEFFINSFIQLLSTLFNFLSNFQFFGISLLSYTIALFVLSVAIPILFSLVRGNVRASKSFARHYKGSSDED